MEKLDLLRQGINETDKQIVLLLERRLDICRQIGEIKRANGQRVYNAAREREVLANVSKGVSGVHMRRIYAAVLREGRRIQRRFDMASVK